MRADNLVALGHANFYSVMIRAFEDSNSGYSTFIVNSFKTSGKFEPWKQVRQKDKVSPLIVSF